MKGGAVASWVDDAGSDAVDVASAQSFPASDARAWACGRAHAAVPAGKGADRAPSPGAGPGDVIVMATHGRGGVTRWFLGSVAEGVVRRAPVPVLLVRALPVPAAAEESGVAPTAGPAG